MNRIIYVIKRNEPCFAPLLKGDCVKFISKYSNGYVNVLDNKNNTWTVRKDDIELYIKNKGKM